MTNLKQELSYLILGQQGGENRIKILEHLKDRSYNINQLANALDLNYRTVKHHMEILQDHELVESSGEGYGDVYFLSNRLEENYEILKEMKNKIETVFESSKLYKKVMGQTNEGIIILDENKDVIFLNDSAKEITGYNEENFLGKNIENFLESDIEQSLEEGLEKDDFVEKTIEIEKNSGEHKNVSATMDHFYFDGDKHKGYSILMRDINEKETQREVLNALMENSEMMIAYLNSDFDLIYANSAYAEETDYTPEELIGKNHFGLFPSEEGREVFEEVLENGRTRISEETELLDVDGSTQDEQFWWLEPVKDVDGDVQGLVLTSYMLEDPSQN